MTKLALYKQAIDARPDSNQTPIANRGLCFDKFGDAWEDGQNGKWDFDKSPWLERFAKKTPGDASALEEACRRRDEMIRAMGGSVLYLRNSSRFVTGLGRTHPLENGFAWHHTLGVPYLPGSGVKGVLRAWLTEMDDPLLVHCGGPDEAGSVILLDLLPTRPPRLAVEIMTPHYGPYYQDKEMPGDWNSPIPINFLAVEENQYWQLGMLSVEGSRGHEAREALTVMCEALKEALDWLGAGAKTAAGFGHFVFDDAEIARQAEIAEEAQRDAEAAADLQNALREASEGLGKFILIAKERGWSEHNGTLLFDFEDILENETRYQRNDRQEAISDPELEKLREALGSEVQVVCEKCLVEFFNKHWPGIWEEPDKTQGQQNRHVHKPRPRAVVKALQKKIEDAAGPQSSVPDQG